MLKKNLPEILQIIGQDNVGQIAKRLKDILNTNEDIPIILIGILNNLVINEPQNYWDQG